MTFAHRSLLSILVFYFFIQGASQRCELVQISLDIKQRDCLKESFLNGQLRTRLNELTTKPLSCPECTYAFPNQKKFSNLYKRPFLILSLEKHGFGGYLVNTIFQNSPYVYAIWMYEIDVDLTQIRSFEKMHPTRDLVPLLNELKSKKKYSKYWMKSQP